jgi:hypothetical protein
MRRDHLGLRLSTTQATLAPAAEHGDSTRDGFDSCAGRNGNELGIVHSAPLFYWAPGDLASRNRKAIAARAVPALNNNVNVLGSGICVGTPGSV